MSVIADSQGSALVEIETFLAGAIERLKTLKGLRKVILFGSHARGTAHPGSDLDLMVVMDDDRPTLERHIEVEKAIELGPGEIGVDVIYLTARQFDSKLQQGSSFLNQVVGEGRILYET